MAYKLGRVEREVVELNELADRDAAAPAAHASEETTRV
jgi:hypothetical protein